MRRVPLFVLFVCAIAQAQSCPRPRAPGAGHPVVLEPQQVVTYSDGYATTGMLRRPAVPTPACGWPLVVFVPRLASTHLDQGDLQDRIAAQGHAVWSYDVRGQGFAILQNPPNQGTTMVGLHERADLAEQIAFALQAYPGLVDGERIAVVGSSQGGMHAWAAAALSGQLVTVPGRGAIAFPSIACAVAADYAAEPALDWLRDELLWSSWFVTLIADDTGRPFVLDESFRQQVRAAFVAQDAAGLAAAWTAEGRRIDQLVPAATVPVLCSHAYFDVIGGPLPTLDLLHDLPVTTPRRVLLSTIGHNTPENAHELAFRDGTIVRWLHRYLWHESNEVELEQPFVLSQLPLEATRRGDPDWPWGRRLCADPLQPAFTTRLHLHADGTLAETEPAGPGAPSLIDQVITHPAFTPENYIASIGSRTLPAVLAACPLSELVFALPPLPAEQQLEGATGVSLALTPDRAEWMLAALLTATPPGGDEVMLSSRGIGSVTSSAGVAERVTFQLSPMAAVLPEGTVLRLRLRNLWLREAPMARQLEVAPRFHDFHLQIAHDGSGAGSWVDVPLMPTTVQLVTRTHAMDLTRLDPLTLDLRAGRRLAGGIYYVLAGVSGQVPGMQLHGTELAVQPDWFTGLVQASLITPEFRGFLGDLDADGGARAVMDVRRYAPLDPAFLGTTLTFGAFAFPAGSLHPGNASNPVDVVLR